MTILPSVVEPEDAASKALLNARGAYFDPEPIAPGIAQLLGDAPAQKELPTEKSDAVVVGQFTRPLAHLSPSGRSVYLQIVVKPLEVLKTDDHKAPHALTLPILIQGGAVHGPSGNIVHSPVAQDYLWVTPGHTYVFFLIRNKTAVFYKILKTWDVTTGIAVPIAHEDRSSGDHVSENDGVSLPALIEKLKEKIALDKAAK